MRRRNPIITLRIPKAFIEYAEHLAEKKYYVFRSQALRAMMIQGFFKINKVEEIADRIGNDGENFDRITFTCPKWMAKYVKELSMKTGMNISEILRQIIVEYVASNSKNVEEVGE